MRGAPPRAMPRSIAPFALALTVACGAQLPPSRGDDEPASERALPTPESELTEVPAPTEPASAAPPAGSPIEGARIVFVTSTLFFANEISGFSTADAICERHAAAGDARLTGRHFKAWLGRRDVGPIDRFVARSASPLPYVRVDGRVVAPSFGALVGGAPLAAAIGLDEVGRPREGSVWTGVNGDGTATLTDCAGWSSALFATPGTLGTISTDPERWSDDDIIAPCSGNARLYCFEDGL